MEFNVIIVTTGSALAIRSRFKAGMCTDIILMVFQVARERDRIAGKILEAIGDRARLA